MNIRPFAPVEYTDAYYMALGQAVNSHNLNAGKGITIRQGTGGLIVQSTPIDNNVDNLHYRGTYDTASSYNVNDIVFVDPNITYYNGTTTSGSSTLLPWEATASYAKPPICAGLFVCVNYVPDNASTYGVLTQSVLPAYAGLSGLMKNDIADTFRHYQYNVYYPVYPTIPTSSRGWLNQSSGSMAWTTVANQTYWMPLTPYLPARFCYNNAETIMFLAGIVSGSTFDITKLPYTGSF